MPTKEKLLGALKAAARAFVVAFIGALGFGALTPGLIESLLKIVGLN